MTRGGKRVNAGRKRGVASIKAEEARKYLSERVAGELEEILAGQIELAKGIYSEVETDEGFRRIYRRLPDSKAAAFLINQTIGRPKETLDMNVERPFSLIALHAQMREYEGKKKEIVRSDGIEISESEQQVKALPAGLSPAEKAAHKARHPEYKEILDKIGW